MITRQELETIILFSKPELMIFDGGKYELCCEVDLFNGHLTYFIREYKDKKRSIVNGDYEFIDYEDAVDKFLNLMNGEIE